MQALVLTRGIPAAGRAGAGRTRHLLSILRASGFDTHLVALLSPTEINPDITHLHELVKSVRVFHMRPGRVLRAIGKWLRFGSYLESITDCPAMTRYVAELMPQISVVVCINALRHETVAAARPPGAFDLEQGRPFYILDLNEPMSQRLTVQARNGGGLGGMVRRIEAAALRKLERAAAEYADLTLLDSHLDLQLVAEHVPHAKLWAMYNGADVIEPSAEPTVRNDDILFCGSMDNDQNRKCAAWFARSVMPQIVRQRPKARLLLVSACRERSLRSVLKLPFVAARDLTGNELTLGIAMQQCSVGVAPQREARAAIEPVLSLCGRGVPVAGTRAVALCLPDDVGAAIVPAQGPNEFAASLIKLLGNHEFAREVGGRARDLVIRCATWEAQWRRLGALLATIAAGNPPQYGSDIISSDLRQKRTPALARV